MRGREEYGSEGRGMRRNRKIDQMGKRKDRWNRRGKEEEKNRAEDRSEEKSIV